jgi:predicted RNA-binding Zn-ribbon protein involved in translation (DUF1610 family)
MATDPHYKYCPECRTEYLLTAARCADCDVDLVDGATVAAQEAEIAAFPPASELACVRVAPIAWIQALSEALQQGGVGHRVEPARAEDVPDGPRDDVFGGAPLFGLYVRQEHEAPARELDASIAAQILPEEAPPVEEGEAESCPACAAGLAPDATECPDCGLEFG